VAGVVGEDGGVAGGEVERACVGLNVVVVSLERTRRRGRRKRDGEERKVGRTLPTKAVAFALPERKYNHSSAFGCQCNSLSAPGLSVTIEAAIVFDTGKFVESTIWIVPPPPGTSVGATSLAL